jgi:hypothetical protein
MARPEDSSLPEVTEPLPDLRGGVTRSSWRCDQIFVEV